MTHKDSRIQLNRNRPVDADLYNDLRLAMRDEGPPYPETPYGATKTAELDVQFSIDPSYGLSKERYGWYSNDVLFDSTFFSEDNGKISIETSATAGDTARITSAFPGQYIAHTVAEPGVGARIPSQHIERGGDDLVSLTHGEISFDIAQFSDTQSSAITSHGISFESDGVYHQVRSNDQNVEFTRQENWNLDPMDGTGPSGRTLKPENGYVYLFIYTWYGEGSCILALQDPQTNDIIPVNRYPAIEGNPPMDSPNMPVLVLVENGNTASPLSVKLGGMQFVTHGGSVRESVSRNTEEARRTTGGYINVSATTTNGAIDPFAEPGVPLVSLRRDKNNIRSRKGLKFTVESLFLNADSNCYLFIFDEYNEESALTGHNFTTPVSRGATNESRLESDTSATAYTPSNDSILRGMAYVSTTNKQTQQITGITTSDVPLEATAVVTAAKDVGANNTDAQPLLVTATEQF